MISALPESRSMTFSLLIVPLLPLVSTFNPFHSLFPLRGQGWRGKGRTTDVIHHCNRRYRLAKRQTCRSFKRLHSCKKLTQVHTGQVHLNTRNIFIIIHSFSILSDDKYKAYSKTNPTRSAFRFHISSRIFLCSLTLSNTSSFLT